jgi:hypothetical protein
LDIIGHWGWLGDREMTDNIPIDLTVTADAGCEVTAITQWRIL